MAKGFVSILIVLLTNLIAVGAQLNLFIAKEDVNSHLSKYICSEIVNHEMGFVPNLCF